MSSVPPSEADASLGSDARSTPRHTPLAPVVFVTGKGGVGKTTIAAGLASAYAERAGEAVLIEFGGGDAGARALDENRAGVIREVIKPEEALVDAAAPLFGSRSLTKLILRNFAVRRLASASPGLHEMAMLEKVRQLAEAYPGRHLIVDLPATGHGLAWLRVPLQFRDFTARGPLHEMSARLVDAVVNPRSCSVVVVTLPEAMVLQETVELCEAMETLVGLPVARLLVNRVPGGLPPQALDDARALTSHPDAELAGAASELVRIIAFRQRAYAEAARALHEGLRRVRLDPLLLPEAPTDPRTADVAGWLRQGGVV